jgi:23S rRNA (cytidine1920-2'-O)/16S rRNA (cytidine1409-2'-O)-methyltransferase
MKKIRLDQLLVEKGIAESREKAKRLIMSGQILVDGHPAPKPGQTLDPAHTIVLKEAERFVSRGGEKLEGAMEAFPIELTGKVCLDIGSSTGGFTDCMLQHGAAKVYAIDVGKGILHWKIRTNARVVVMEETNARYIESLPEKIDFVTIDASFISLKVLLPVVKKWIAPLQLPPNAPHLGGVPRRGEGGIITLIKPQFEAGKKDVAHGQGVIRDPAIHKQVLTDVLAYAHAEGFGLLGLIRSPLLGPKGNTEFLAWLTLAGGEEPSALIQSLFEG